jgi:quinol monooxygenase YgiN
VSTIVIAKYRADPARFKKLVKSADIDFTAVARSRMAKGCISHRYAVGDDVVYVIDEWPSIEEYNDHLPSGQGWPHEVAIEAGLEEPPETIFMEVVPDPGAFMRYPGSQPTEPL